MELGLSLEDEDLGQTRNRSTTHRLTSFNAKVCRPLWFVSEISEADLSVSENNSQVLKFTGDYNYYQGDYSCASEFYSRSLAVLPSNSQATRLDLRQSLVRCYLKLGRLAEADNISQMLAASAQNVDHKKQVFLLRLEVSLAMKKHDEAERCLVFLINLQPHLSQLWLQLAELLQADSCGSHDITSKLVTCYVRVKLLLQSTLPSVSRIIQSRDQTILQQVMEKLDKLEISEDVRQRAEEFLRFDLKQEAGVSGGRPASDQVLNTDSDMDNVDTPQPANPDSPDSFYTFWCSWNKPTST